jgi:tetratricopeptide (TPR) repeat protein
MSRHRFLGAGLLAAVLLLPGFLQADEPPPGMPPEFHKMFQQSSPRKLKPLARTLDGGVEGFKYGRVADAEAVLKPLADGSRNDGSFPLYLLTLGSVELALGDYQRAASVLTAATTNLSVELGSVRTGIAILEAESERPYRGYPHEKMLARTYLGLAYYQQARHEDARIEFAKAREEHRGRKAGQDNDFVTGHFLEGLNSLRDRRYNDAQVSFRKVTELKQDWALGWYALCRASDVAGSTPEADESWARYEALTSAESRLARDGSTRALFLVESVSRFASPARSSTIWAPGSRPDPALNIALGAWPVVPAQA